MKKYLSSLAGYRKSLPLDMIINSKINLARIDIIKVIANDCDIKIDRNTCANNPK
jgi:hypothetical protein